jgi:catechol 2,3-dioxygenase
MIRPRKLAHIVLNVRDAQAAKAFYTRALGLVVAAESKKKDQAFLSFGKEHHDLGLFQRVNGPARDPRQPGLTHIAWQFDSPADLEAVLQRLQEACIAAETVRKGDALERLYVRDPDGNQVELYCGAWDAGLEAMLEKAHG